MAKGDVFVGKEDSVTVRFSGCGVAHDTSREPSQYIGWRERPDGTRERVEYFTGWGWMTLDERAEMRAKYRDAP